MSKTSEWFQQAVPSPTEDNVRVQIGVHVEEFSEMLEQINFAGDNEAWDSTASWFNITFKHAVKQLADHLKKGALKPEILDHVEMLDSLCDQRVTAIGVGHMLGYDMDAAIDEVDRSNWSKFDEDGKPIFNENGKVMKGPNYTKPKLKPMTNK